jgi:protein-S-isoprenylcysteine O-methyltransferase Ste14
MQNLSIFLVLFYVFGGVAYFVLCGTYSAFLASTVIVPSSHNIVASLCYWSVNHFILVVTILMYDYKPTLNIIVRKLFMIGICKPFVSF